MGMIVKVNLRDYRELLGFSQEDLGAKVGVTRQTIAAWERGDSTPTVAFLFRLASELGVAPDLLFGPLEPEAALLFRADDSSSLSPALRAVSARRAENYSTVEDVLGFVPALPESRPLSKYDAATVESVARDTRAWLGVRDAPLSDGISLLEEKGVKVLLLELPDKVSGFSAYTEDMGGIIFVNSKHRVERQVFTAFHELAHLIFHRREYKTALANKKKDDPKEKIANHFAGAVLLPAEAVHRELRFHEGRWLPDALLVDMKIRYRVSMRTVLMRASQVGAITKNQAGRQIGFLNKKYGKYDEPVCLDRPRTHSRLERLTFTAALRGLITTSRAAEILERPLLDVRGELARWATTLN